MRKKFTGLPISALVLAVGTLFWAMTGYAQLTTGKIEGTVRDKDTGQPLAGSQVSIEGTRLGNVTNEDGYYFILNVPPGLRTITATYTGYQKTSIGDQRILAGQTATVDFELSSTVIQIEGIMIEGEAEVLVPRDNTVTKQRLSAETIDMIAIEDLKGVLELQAGVATGGEGGLRHEMRIRGGRPGEEAIIVDGIMVRNLIAEPLAVSDEQWWDVQENQNSTTTIPLELSTAAVEQVDVITGGWQAEYGNVQSGIINIVTKSGGPNIKGRVRFTTDELNPEAANWGYNRLQSNIGGPLGIPFMTFNLTAELVGLKDMNPTHADEGYRGITQLYVDRLNKTVKNMTELGPNPYSMEIFENAHAKFREYQKTDKDLQDVELANPHEARLPNNWGDKTLLSGKLRWNPLSSLMLFSTANFSRNQRVYYEHEDLYNKGRIYSFGEENQAMGDEVRYFPPYFGERLKTHTVMAGFDWDIFKSAGQYALLQGRFSHMYNTQVIFANPQRGWERETTLGWSAEDMPFELEWYPNREIRMTNPVHVERFPDKTSPEEWNLPVFTPFGFPAPVGFEGDGYILWYDFLQENQNVYKFDFDYQWSRWNRLKTGFDYTPSHNHQFRILSWELARLPQREFRYEPRILGSYIQNRLDVGDFVMNFGVRYDRFDPHDSWAVQNYDEFGYYYFPKKVSSFSPRFDVGFPVTDRTQLRLAYGRFSQLPSLTYIYSGSNYGGLEYQVTESFEAGLTHLIGKDWVVDLVTYYKDVIGNVSSREFWRDYQYLDQTAQAWRLNRGYSSGYANKDSGNIKGLDLTLRKVFNQYYSLNATYTLEFSRTTGSIPNSAEDEVFANIDPTTNQTSLPPDELSVIDQDRTHKLNVWANLSLPHDFGGEGTSVNKVLRDFSATATFRLLSGTPFTRTGELMSGLSMNIGGFNFFRGRSYHTVDLRLNKSFALGGARLSVFSEIYNLLNRKEPVQWSVNWTYTNIADYYRYGHAAMGKPFEQMTELMNKAFFLSDYNGDGMMSLNEMVMGRVAQGFAAQADANPMNWGRPRQVRLGLELDF